MISQIVGPKNPLRHFAEFVPPDIGVALSVAARVAGAAAALFYAYDQDTLFPGEHFPRTWVFCLVVAAVALGSLGPIGKAGVKPGLVTWFGALGCGILVFGGANLAHKGPGVVVLAAGVIAWLAYASAAAQRGKDVGAVVSGLLMGSLLSFLLVGFCVLAIQN